MKDYHATQNTTLTSRTWTIRDAQGTVLAIYTRKPTVGNSGSATRTEAPIYGSSRIGQNTRTATNDATASDEATLLGTVYSRELCKRAYELVDHLGNVRATISDILVPRTATNTYDADVLTLTDYYPFGMQMDTRTWEASGVAGHRYGYNGQEREDEIKGSGNSYDFEFRIYDPRVVRFLSIDPLSKQYPMLTPYQFASNRPIDGIDIKGQEWKSQHKWSDKITDKSHIKLLGSSYVNGMTYQQAWSVMAPTLLEAKKGDTYDCADLSITVLVEFAYMFRLSVHFQDYKNDGRDSEFDNDAYGYRRTNGKWTRFKDGDWKALASAIAGQYGAADLFLNSKLTKEISFKDLKAGDLVGWSYDARYFHSQTVASVCDSWWFDFDDVNDYYTTIQGSLRNGRAVPAYEKEYDINSVKNDPDAKTKALQWNTELFDKKK